MALASILKIQRHDDYLVMLKVRKTNPPTKLFHPALRHPVRVLVFYVLQSRRCIFFWLLYQAIRILIQERLSPEAIKRADQNKEVKPRP